jgi:hypothetical protein
MWTWPCDHVTTPARSARRPAFIGHEICLLLGRFPLQKAGHCAILTTLARAAVVAFSTPDLHPGVGVTLLPGPVSANGDGAIHPVGCTGATLYMLHGFGACQASGYASAR